MKVKPFINPFRPGAGHMPPYLAGRKNEENEFRDLLKQETILKNMILTGLRGVGKTVLLESFKPIAIQERWGWVGTDLSESASIKEETLATRILADLAVFTSTLTVQIKDQRPGFVTSTKESAVPVNYIMLNQLFNSTPGLISDKLKFVLEYVWKVMQAQGKPGIVFAYDEAQNLADLAAKDQYPLSMLLEVFQSIQRKEIRFILVLTGLPTLFPKLVEARTYSERMFHQVFLNPLSKEASREAITIPIKKSECPIVFNNESVETIVEITAGYPYFIQFICKEVYDIWIQRSKTGEATRIPVAELIAKLDSDFFAGRWARATNRQRDLLRIISTLPNCDTEFTVHDIVYQSKKEPEKQFSSSHVNQMLSSLSNAGLIYRNRYGKYSFAVPLLGQFIRRQVIAD